MGRQLEENDFVGPIALLNLEQLVAALVWCADHRRNDAFGSAIGEQLARAGFGGSADAGHRNVAKRLGAPRTRPEVLSIGVERTRVVTVALEKERIAKAGAQLGRERHAGAPRAERPDLRQRAVARLRTHPGAA